MLTFRTPVEILEAYGALTPEQIQESIAHWQGWIGELAAKGQFAGTEQLQPVGRTLTGPTMVQTDGPFLELKEVLGGFMLVLAQDLDEATEIAKKCPVLMMGGSVEIRPVVDMGM